MARKATARTPSAPSAVPAGVPDPRSPGFWRSPLRGLRLTASLGLVLLVGITAVLATGLLSYAAYDPDLPGNDQTPDKGILGFFLFAWPTDPYWLYRLTQGVHVVLGVALVPVVLAKLWSVMPKLFAWPPVRSPAQALERVTVLLLVGGAGFECATGLLDIQLSYVFPGSFYALHYYGAWVFTAGFASHVALKLPRAVQAVRPTRTRRRARATRPDGTTAAAPVGDGGTGSGARAAWDDERGLRAPDPAPATLSRRGALAMTGLGSLAVIAVTAGQSIGGGWRRTALLAPHGGPDPAGGPNGFQINKTAAHLRIRPRDIGPRWRLTVHGPHRAVVLTRERLLAMPQGHAALPIACVEGWSTDDQEWSGVRLTDLAALVGLADRPPGVLVRSVQRGGAFGSASLADNQVRDARTLLALRVNGADLSPDHGYPARIIAPAVPGVHQTKWVTRLDFGHERRRRT